MQWIATSAKTMGFHAAIQEANTRVGVLKREEEGVETKKLTKERVGDRRTHTHTHGERERMREGERERERERESETLCERGEEGKQDTQPD
jgi:hypothetical protein